MIKAKTFRYSFRFGGSADIVERTYYGTLAGLGELIHELRACGCDSIEYYESDT